jgi:hypothetical protein
VERLSIADVGQLGVAAHHELIQRLIDELDLPVFWSGRTMPTLENTFGSLLAPAGAIGRQTEMSPKPSPVGRLESTREVIREARKPDTVDRPLTFGDVSE